MAIILYDLCAGDAERRFSPHCWKAKLALAHKDLQFETRPVPFTRIKDIGGGFSPTVPVIDDGGKLVRDSFDIAIYLEETYAERPSLFRGKGGESAARFVESWALSTLHPLLMRLIVGEPSASVEGMWQSWQDCHSSPWPKGRSLPSAVLPTRKALNAHSAYVVCS